MPTIRQYRPAYVTGFENETKEFSSLEELLSIEFVDNFRKLPNGQTNPRFHQFSISEIHGEFGYVLMAEYSNGFEWWVVGYINDNDGIKDMPSWTPKYEKKE